jgi:RNA polymerase sigma factor (sigma-70 family)
MTAKVAFEAIVARHGPTVMRVCRALVGAADADDAWSDTFLAAMRAYPELPVDANVEAWLVTIAHRKTIDLIRAQNRRAIPVGTMPERADRSSYQLEADPELAEALDGLPPKQKHAVTYHYVAGMPYAEVAELLGGTPDAARRAAADGMATLRRTYTGAAQRKGTRR